MGIPDSPSSSTLRFQVDEAVIDFMEWVRAKADEKEIGPAGKQPGKGKTWVPRYANIGDILKEYGPSESDAPAIDDEELTRIIAATEAATPTEF
jgi:hypothetical protein